MPAILFSCLKVFFCRVMDVTMGTVRTVLTVKGKNTFAALMGFCEVFIWYVVVQDAMKADGPVIPVALAYAGGYAAGTYIGGQVANKLIKGSVAIQVITSDRNPKLLDAIRDEGFAISVIDVAASEYSGPKFMVIAKVDKKEMDHFRDFVLSMDPKAFILVQETKMAIGGYSRPAK